MECSTSVFLKGTRAESHAVVESAAWRGGHRAGSDNGSVEIR